VVLVSIRGQVFVRSADSSCEGRKGVNSVHNWTSGPEPGEMLSKRGASIRWSYDLVGSRVQLRTLGFGEAGAHAVAGDVNEL
jgi:hypothetical protein